MALRVLELGPRNSRIRKIESKEDVLEKFPKCSEGIGKLKDYEAKININPQIAPVAQKLTFTGEQAVPPVQVFSILKSKGVVVPGEVDALQALQGRNTYDLRFTSDVTRQKGVTLLSGVEGLTVTPYERSVWVTVIHVGLELTDPVPAPRKSPPASPINPVPAPSPPHSEADTGSPPASPINPSSSVPSPPPVSPDPETCLTTTRSSVSGGYV
ncbi:hypothetical protein BSL78_24840 [Apostichopus japonicus]|uniref:Uncharacterized protein n=1 Tax=Stichopus japonicus TaxID=307972 RepID=A0A2G8JRD3_STIJA|nr:hypothetical protein BSL78_24840 [Apostichopus japonicus]